MVYKKKSPLNVLYGKRKKKEKEIIVKKAEDTLYVEDIIYYKKKCNQGIAIVYPTADGHPGASGGNITKLRLANTKVATLDHSIVDCFAIGDNLQINNSLSPGNMFDDVLTPGNELVIADHVYGPIYPVLRFVLFGNHDGNGKRNAVSDIYPGKHWADRISAQVGYDIPSSPYNGVVSYEFPTPDDTGRTLSFEILLSHGSGKGSSDMMALDKTKDAATSSLAQKQSQETLRAFESEKGDIKLVGLSAMFMAHLHAGADGNLKIPVIFKNKKGKSVVKQQNLKVVNTHSSQEKCEYAAVAHMGPTSTDQYVYVFTLKKNPYYEPNNGYMEFDIVVDSINIFSKEFDDLQARFPNNDNAALIAKAKHILSQKGEAGLIEEFNKNTDKLNDLSADK